MPLPVRAIQVPICLLAGLVTASTAFAQNWSFDARTIGMGGVGSTSNVGQRIIDERRPYRVLVLPFGLAQVLPNLPSFDPTKDDFDLVRAIEYGASPIHYIVGRDDASGASAFVNDLRNGQLSRDLNTYSFSPATSFSAEGLASPNWGHTFKLRTGADGSFHGIYAGAGPYFSMRTTTAIDPAFAAIVSSSTPVYVPNTSLYMSNDTESQFALAVTGGYRGRLAWWSSSAADTGLTNQPPPGLYVGVNLHYLHGFSYELFEPNARLDTNAQGLLTVNPALGLPVTLVRNTSTGGSGFALDTGVAVVIRRWEIAFGVNGIANRLNWNSVERTNYVLDSLFNGGDFNDTPTVLVGDVRVELPVDTRTSATYNTASWSATTEYGHGYNGNTFRAGYEHRLDRVQLRAGARYIKERWEPTGGVGYDISDGFGVDVGLFSTSANLERQRRLAIAVSLRFMTRNRQ